jgi:PDZ domain-containing protein
VLATWHTGNPSLAMSKSQDHPRAKLLGGKGSREDHRGARSPALLSALGAVVLAIVVVVALSVHFSGQYFVFSPGTAPVITTSARCQLRGGELALANGTPCVRLMVPPSRSDRIEGRILMVDVEVSQANPLQWLAYELGLLDNHSQLVTVSSYAGNTPISELGCQDAQQMSLANQDATIAALSALHYRVAEKPLGAQVLEVVPGTPAWRAGIKCNDLITAVDGKPTHSAAAFSKLLAPLPPGTVVTLTDHPGGAKRARQVSARLAPPPRQLVESGLLTDRAYLGVSVGTEVRLELPFPVTVQAGPIGGPSAGLAFALAIIDSVSGGRLTGGHAVAATGTISADGQVGPVGGVAEKTIAVERAGAQVFFVPVAEYNEARSVASKRLHVVGVATLAQALRVLTRHYGGVLPY